MAHQTSFRVRYGEVDRMGVVYHANYLPYFELGRTEFLRGLGRAYRAVEDAGVLLVVADAALKYHRPAGYDDLLRVTTRLASMSGVRLRFEYEIDRPADGTLVASGHTTLAATDRDGKPTRLVGDVSRLLAEVVEPEAPARGGEGGAGAGGESPGKNAPTRGVQGRAS